MALNNRQSRADYKDSCSGHEKFWASLLNILFLKISGEVSWALAARSYDKIIIIFHCDPSFSNTEHCEYDIVLWVAVDCSTSCSEWHWSAHMRAPGARCHVSTLNGCVSSTTEISWWRHQMETFSALLAICAGNSPVPDEFAAQRPVTRSFDVFFDLRLNKRLSKQSWDWWIETLSHPLWRHCNVFSATRYDHE